MVWKHYSAERIAAESRIWTVCEPHRVDDSVSEVVGFVLAWLKENSIHTEIARFAWTIIGFQNAGSTIGIAGYV